MAIWTRAPSCAACLRCAATSVTSARPGHGGRRSPSCKRWVSPQKGACCRPPGGSTPTAERSSASVSWPRPPAGCSTGGLPPTGARLGETCVSALGAGNPRRHATLGQGRQSRLGGGSPVRGRRRAARSDGGFSHPVRRRPADPARYAQPHRQPAARADSGATEPDGQVGRHEPAVPGRHGWASQGPDLALRASSMRAGSTDPTGRRACWRSIVSWWRNTFRPGAAPICWRAVGSSTNSSTAAHGPRHPLPRAGQSGSRNVGPAGR